MLINLARFGAAVFEEAREELADLDGGDLQELMQEHGLLHEVRVTQPCSSDDDATYCRCAEYVDFPQQGLRPVDGLSDLIEAITTINERTTNP